MTSAICRVDCRNTLGEGCVWDPRDSSLYWTDIEEKKIFRLGPDSDVVVFALPERAGFVLPRREEGFVVGFASGIARADRLFSRFERIVEIEPELSQTRVNDAAADPYGGVVFGTFDERDRKPVAAVYRLAPNGSLRRLLTGVTVSNGLAFSPDGRTLYFADTPVGTIRRFAVGPDFESFDEIPPLAGPDIAPGKPDGAVVDAEGGYWNARVWGGCLVRIAPDGRLTDRIDLPAKGPTCVALGGPDLTQLFVTSLRLRHSDDELLQMPKAGGLFEATVAVAGAAQRLCLL
jgi:L-arabinonolactonase